jgi:hypothetical protein
MWNICGAPFFYKKLKNHSATRYTQKADFKQTHPTGKLLSVDTQKQTTKAYFE